jgi:hypothetical protein
VQSKLQAAPAWQWTVQLPPVQSPPQLPDTHQYVHLPATHSNSAPAAAEATNWQPPFGQSVLQNALQAHDDLLSFEHGGRFVGGAVDASGPVGLPSGPVVVGVVVVVGDVESVPVGCVAASLERPVWRSDHPDTRVQPGATGMAPARAAAARKTAALFTRR